jgi:hypothetical protein
MQRAAKTKARKHLRQQRRQPGATTSEDERALAEQLFVARHAAREVIQHLVDRQQRQFRFAPFTADDIRTIARQRFLDKLRIRRRDLYEFFEYLAAEHQVRGIAAFQLTTKSVFQRRLRDERQVDEVRVDRIEPLAGFLQDFKAARQVLLQRLGVAGDRSPSCRDRLILQVDLVQVAHVPHLAREQLDEQEGEAEGVEIGHDLGVDRRRRVLQLAERFGHDRRSGEMSEDHHGPAVAGSIDPA